jgi:hypothetical protein
VHHCAIDTLRAEQELSKSATVEVPRSELYRYNLSRHRPQTRLVIRLGMRMFSFEQCDY